MLSNGKIDDLDLVHAYVSFVMGQRDQTALQHVP
jgi:hypothetical protein